MLTRIHLLEWLQQYFGNNSGTCDLCDLERKRKDWEKSMWQNLCTICTHVNAVFFATTSSTQLILLPNRINDWASDDNLFFRFPSSFYCNSWTIFFKWAKPGLFLPLFAYFRPFLVSQHSDKCSTHLTIKSVDGVLGTRTWAGRMVGADESAELFWPPLNDIFINRINLFSLEMDVSWRDILQNYKCVFAIIYNAINLKRLVFEFMCCQLVNL